jgi:MOSC domain-containing protein YiiM
MMASEFQENGQLISISVGLPLEVEWNGEAIRTGIFKSPILGPVQVDPSGLFGDGQADLTVHGGLDKAVYAFDEATTEYWRAALARPNLSAGAFGENLTLEGWPETSVRIGDRFRIGEAEFQVSQPRQPCFKLGMLFDDPTLPKRFIKSGRVGYYLRVLEAGRIEAGNEVIRLETDPTSLDVESLVGIWRDREASTASLERAAGLESLADAWREPLRKRLLQRSTLSS